MTDIPEPNGPVETKHFVLLVDDPEPVFVWLRKEGASAVVSPHADSAVVGFEVKVALESGALAERFEARWSADFYDKQFERRAARPD